MSELFRRHRAASKNEFEWEREEITAIAKKLRVKIPKNLGDNIYAIRHGRNLLPESVISLAAPKHWLLLPNGRGKYRFAKAKNGPILADTTFLATKIPNATPQIVERYALSDEQAVLARIRYNRLVDLFFGISAYPLQSHLRTTVNFFEKSQIETDDLYVGIDKAGVQYVIPVQAKGSDELPGAVQAVQDIYCCRERFPNLLCRAIAAQKLRVEKDRNGVDVYTIALMELAIDTDTEYDVSKIQERHFKLVSHTDISDAELQQYRVSIGKKALTP